MTKILLVEDDKSLREIYGVRLLAEGYDIVSAGDGEEALAMAIKDRPSLIVSDVMMPKISGFDMLDILRSTTETKDIKVIMMTALSSEDQRKRGEQLGADRYLVKSQVGIEDVVRAVHEVLADAPTTGSANAFSSAPSAVPAPAPASPAAPSTPAPVPSVPAAGPRPATPVSAPPRPASPQPTQSATPAPTPMPTPSASPAPQSGLPQPTAPFSTPRPGSLADRVIQPITKSDDAGTPVSEMMEQELSGGGAKQNPFESDTPATPSENTAPTSPAAPSAPAPSETPTGLNFEETPRPASTPFPPAPPQTPTA